MNKKTNEEWQTILSPEQYQVCRQKATEKPHTGALLHNTKTGNYHCVCCGALLFDSKTKFDSGSGWPSFWRTALPNTVLEVKDNSHGMIRTEVVCASCNAHLGHVFNDGPEPTRLRYCINSVALKFTEEKSK